MAVEAMDQLPTLRDKNLGDLVMLGFWRSSALHATGINSINAFATNSRRLPISDAESNPSTHVATTFF